MSKISAPVCSKKAYWSKYAVESSDDSESFVPGVTIAGNRRPSKMQGKKTQEIKAKIPVKQPVVENLSPSYPRQEMSESCDDSSVMSHKYKKRPQQVSLKDLSDVDKKRIANLVKELARMGDEREKAVGQLHQERKEFEKQVLQLVDQQEKILNEREDIQSKLFQCQDLLTKYQDKILEKQEKLNASISEYANTPPKNGTSECSLSQWSLSQGTLSDNDQDLEETYKIDNENNNSELPHVHLTCPVELNAQIKSELSQPPSNSLKAENVSKPAMSKLATSKIVSSKPVCASKIVATKYTGSKKAITKKSKKISKHGEHKAKWTTPKKDPWSEGGKFRNSSSKQEKILVHQVDTEPRETTLVHDKTPVSLLEKISWLDPRRDEINVRKVDIQRATGAKQGSGDVNQKKRKSGKTRHEHRSRSQSPEDVYQSPQGSEGPNYQCAPRSSHHRNIPEEKRTSYPVRPFTSKIDKEIALQRSYNEREGLSTILSERTERDTGQGRLRYMDKVPTIKAFREPIMSSTQKSSEINPYTSGSQEDHFQALVPDSSPRSSRMSDLDPTPLNVKDKENIKSNVKFTDKHLEVEYDQAKLHSPNLVSESGVFGDKSFMNYYKKLSQTERKRELLRQRQSLLEEQRRLKEILRSQEYQLKNKQDQLHRQQILQQERLAYFEKNGKFPLGRPRTDVDCEVDLNRKVLVERDNKSDDFVLMQRENKTPSPHGLSPKPGLVPVEQRYRDTGDDGSLFGAEVKRLNFDRQVEEINVDDIEEEAAAVLHDSPGRTPTRRSAATSPIHRSELQQKSAHSIATSPIRMDQSNGTVHKHMPARGIDVATSISHVNMSPRSQNSTVSVEELILGRQGNLPLPSNRGRSCQSPVPSGPRTPGDKTLSVMEIVNTLDQSPSWAGSGHGNNRSHAHKQFGTPPIHGAKVPEESYEEDEESRVLEDVFFLRG